MYGSACYAIVAIGHRESRNLRGGNGGFRASIIDMSQRAERDPSHRLECYCGRIGIGTHRIALVGDFYPITRGGGQVRCGKGRRIAADGSGGVAACAPIPLIGQRLGAGGGDVECNGAATIDNE